MSIFRIIGILIIFLICLGFVVSFMNAQKVMGSFHQITKPMKQQVQKQKKSVKTPTFILLKDVGEAYMDHFGLSDQDFKQMKAAGVTHIEGNFDICASDEDVRYFLNQSQRYGLQVIMPAGAGEAEWGYDCDQESYSPTQGPVWQKNKVVAWVKKWKNHPAIYAWDISNEAGSVFPNARWNNDMKGTVPDALYITAPQLQTAYRDVKLADAKHPLMIRMNGWFFYDNDSNFFRSGNPFAIDVADIVMINAYSNVEDYYSDFVDTVMDRAIDAVQRTDPDVDFIVSLGVWREPPLWYLPTKNQLNHDLKVVASFDEPLKLSFFKYGARGSEWYLPEDAPEIWKRIGEIE